MSIYGAPVVNWIECALAVLEVSSSIPFIYIYIYIYIRFTCFQDRVHNEIFFSRLLFIYFLDLLPPPFSLTIYLPLSYHFLIYLRTIFQYIVIYYLIYLPLSSSLLFLFIYPQLFSHLVNRK